ncbi:glutamine--fructose-6-phosphate transaminase [Sporobacter termitidis DSM 10068]|uniref:Glutamine--fructose-6-phosphate aminotransferase [isomerizing] n=1 Tax=Sporobacter termitidis DSM 10068 TaxID=1123282 RepID=A0A1M5TTG9_9FIRM|nr:glutamine--fructose-6-phosphate transaminase (isomerizing) [Sporobacter termitidis]SHH53981.1 glutamine--fructose-6-phosphate transaminase [Sporobacter termitidis DSM 10068]
MCGIVGYTGKQEAAPIMLEGLKRLEYRGYDSAGIVVSADGELRLTKAKGFVDDLSKKIDGGRLTPGTTGIGHTRWATHGKPSDENAHPHVSCNGKIALVHNGIIENYQKLREMLISKGIEFKSETDTEVAVNLIQYFYKGDIVKAVSEAALRMEGSYALGIICEDFPDLLLATRKESPLILGIGQDENFLASDVAAVLKYTRDIYYLADDEIAVISPKDIKIYSCDLEVVKKEPSRVDWDISAAEKGGYEHFMFKEIMEQPEAVRKTLSPRIKDGRIILDDIELEPDYIKGLSRIYIVGCGSAYHVGVVAKYNMEKLVRIPVEAVLASEFRYASPLVDASTLVICISQSGTTADTIAAMREAKKLGARVLSIVNVVGSVIASESDYCLYTWAGPEIAVATTKAYSTQLAVTYLIALVLAESRGTITSAAYASLVDGLQALPSALEEALKLKEHIQYLASIYFNKENIFFIGRNIDYALTLEASLKLKEISYIHSDAYAAGELKHGTISLIEEGTLVIAMASYIKLVDKTVSNIVEVKSRGAEILTLTTESGLNHVTHTSDNIITIPDIHEVLLPSLAVVPMQLFAYYVALMRGCSIDKPRNLAKSVTVE